MSLIKRSNWNEGSMLGDFFDDDRFFSSPWLRGQHMPAVNVKETDKSYEVELAAPGFNKKDINIAVDNGLLTVSGENSQEKETKQENYSRREFGYSSFSRSFNLPANINEEDIEAKYADGILKLSISKRGLPTAKEKKKIEIK